MPADTKHDDILKAIEASTAITKASEIADVNYYQIFNISEKADESDIKKAYRKLAITYHPDKNNSPEAERVFKIVAEIYDTLSDTTKRFDYNRTLPEEKQAAAETTAKAENKETKPTQETASAQPGPKERPSHKQATQPEKPTQEMDSSAPASAPPKQKSDALIESKDDFIAILNIVTDSLARSTQSRDPNAIVADQATALYYLSQLKQCCKSGILGEPFALTPKEKNALKWFNVSDFSAVDIMGKYVNSADTYRWTLDLLAYKEMTAAERKTIDPIERNTFERYLPYADAYLLELHEVAFKRTIEVTPEQLKTLYTCDIESLHHIKVKGDLTTLPIEVLEHFLMQGGKIAYKDCTFSSTQLVQLRQSAFLSVDTKAALQHSQIYRNPLDADKISSVFSAKETQREAVTSPDESYYSRDIPSPKTPSFRK